MLAINRQEIIDVMFKGRASKPHPPKLWYPRPDVPAELAAKWKAWADENYRYDPEEAKRLLEEAGYGDGFTFDAWSPPDTAAPYLADLLLTVAAYWEEIGAHANVVPVDGGTYRAHWSARKSTELYGKVSIDASGLIRASTPDALVGITSVGSQQWLYGSEMEAEADEVYKAAMSEMDLARRAELTDRLVELHALNFILPGILEAPIFFAAGPRVDALAPLPFNHVSQIYEKWIYTGMEAQ
jgi:ABC-type transport system substrate-binding protein